MTNSKSNQAAHKNFLVAQQLAAETYLTATGWVRTSDIEGMPAYVSPTSKDVFIQDWAVQMQLAFDKE